MANDTVSVIAIDRDGNKWFGTYWVIIKFDGTTWTNYDTLDGLIYNVVSAIAIDSEDNKWFGTWRGVSKFDGTNWTTYTESDGLVYKGINTIAIDHNNNKWFGTNWGISMLVDSSTGIQEETPTTLVKPKNFFVSYNHGNITIRYTIPYSTSVRLEAYDTQGKLVKVITDKFMQKGSYSVRWDSKRFGSGVYFVKLSANGSAVSKKFTIIK